MNTLTKIDAVDKKVETIVQAHVKALWEWSGLKAKYNKALLLILSATPSIYMWTSLVHISTMAWMVWAVAGLDKLKEWVNKTGQDMESLRIAEGEENPEEDSIGYRKTLRLMAPTVAIACALIEVLSSENKEELQNVLRWNYNLSLISLWLYILFALHDWSDQWKKVTDKLKDIIEKMKPKKTILQPALAKT